ncbi:hypothetical protein C8F01DRAFT_1281383 [Mycena amicta]|nr:hypothetical protein C8F01DRAFT_1281383 [Mycena amicta]
MHTRARVRAAEVEVEAKFLSLAIEVPISRPFSALYYPAPPPSVRLSPARDYTDYRLPTTDYRLLPTNTTPHHTVAVNTPRIRHSTLADGFPSLHTQTQETREPSRPLRNRDHLLAIPIRTTKPTNHRSLPTPHRIEEMSSTSTATATAASSPSDRDITTTTTTTSTSDSTQTQTNNNNTPPKRPSRRRAPTAERRASHNAVERARRETLNGRFLTLASMLPPLRVMRRPSKSAIVNSSIATVHASRRHRVLAAQTLKTIMREADALRREVNEWRTRAHIPTLDTPLRSDADAHALDVVLRGEVEELDIDLVGELDEEDGDEEDGEEGDETKDEVKEKKEEKKEEEDVKPQIKTNTTQRFAFDAANAMSMSPLTPMSAMSMSIPSPSMAMSMPSPGGSDGSWEGPRTPPTSASGVSMPMMYRNKAYQQHQHQQFGAGAAYDLGLGLFDHHQVQHQQHPVPLAMSMPMYQDEYTQGFTAGMGMSMGSTGGWATVNPAHPSYHGHQHQPVPVDLELYGALGVGVAPGQYLHHPAAAGRAF